MPEFLILKPQPNFPHEDVSEVNAQIFEQLLLEPEYIFIAHELAEENVTAFKMGHSSLKSLGYVLYRQPEQQRAFSYGATVYEALSTVVRPIQQRFVENIHIGRAMATLFDYRDDTASAIMRILDEEERFSEESPVAARLVETAAAFYPDFDKRLVLWGAALERSIDKDMTEKTA